MSIILVGAGYILDIMVHGGWFTVRINRTDLLRHGGNDTSKAQVDPRKRRN